MSTASTGSRLPVHVLTGFLGAGKTTLVNRVLSERHGERIAVLVNEFGDVPIDGRLVQASEEDVVELANGCVCCTVRGDLPRAIGRLLRRRWRLPWSSAPRFERLLIETSGLASPGPVVRTLALEPELAAATRPAGVVALAHAALIARQLRGNEEAGEQIGHADALVLNHCDRTDAPGLAAAEAALRSRNPTARLWRTERARVDVGDLLAERPAAPEVAGDAEHGHDARAAAIVLRARVPLDLHRLKLWLSFLCNRRGGGLWRLKGLVRCRERAEAVLIQGVPPWLELGPAEGTPPAESLLVLIGRELDRAELERGWAACSAPASQAAESADSAPPRR